MEIPFKKLLSVVVYCVIGLSSLTAHTQTSSSPNVLQPHGSLATVVIILDDIGNSLSLGERAIQLPGAINYSILPLSPNGVKLAQSAHNQGKEVMLHMPMSNIKGQQVGPGALTPAMDKEQFIQALRSNLKSIPHVKGVNNHMGSLLTQLRQPMSWFMTELKKQQLYFVDSRTSPLTVAEAQAQSVQLPNLRRHVFLDNLRTEKAISIQFERLVKLAKKQGTAVAIGHPHPETLRFLEHALPALPLRGIRMAFVSEVINPTEDSCPKRIIFNQNTDENCLKLNPELSATSPSHTEI